MLSPRVNPASLTLAAAGVDMRLGRAGLCISGMKCDESPMGRGSGFLGACLPLLPGPWDLLPGLWFSSQW